MGRAQHPHTQHPHTQHPHTNPKHTHTCALLYSQPVDGQVERAVEEMAVTKGQGDATEARVSECAAQVQGVEGVVAEALKALEAILNFGTQST